MSISFAANLMVKPKRLIAHDAPESLCHLPRAGQRMLLDHLVGCGQQGLRDGEAQGLGGLEVDDQLDLVGTCTGRSAGFSPLRMRST